MTEFTVGQRVRNANGLEVTVAAVFEPDRYGTDILVRDRDNYVWLERSSDCSPIPDTVTVELSREDAEGFAALDGYGHRTGRLAAACRTALAAEKEGE